MITLILVKNPFSPQDGREVKKIEAKGTVADLLNEYAIEGMDMLATVNGKTVDADTEICDEDFIIIYPAIEKGGGGKGGGKGILGIIGAIVLSVVSLGVGGLVATGVWGSFAGASAMATMGGLLASATIMFLGSSLIARNSGQKLDKGQGLGEEATYGWSGVTTMEGQNNPVALTYGVVKSGGQTIAKYTMASGSDDYLYWLVSAGEGEVEITDIRLNNNAIGLYRDVSYQVRNGTNDQSIIPYFGDTHFTLPLSYNMETLNTWYSALAQGNAIQGLIVKVECPNGLLHTTNEGKAVENYVAIQIEIQKGAGSWVSYNSFSGADLTDWDSSKNALVIKGSSTKAIRKEYRIDRIPADEYSVRVRVTERGYSDPQRDTFATYYTGLSSVIYDDFLYPCTALIGIKAKATGQLSGSPTLSFMKVRGTIYAYNPHTEKYEQKSANNPAWACYDVLHQCRYLKNIRTGSYQYEVRGVPRELMRYDDFANWAAYCDTKHFNVNIEIVAVGEMLDVVNERIAPIGHGLVVRFGTKYGAIYSHPQTPVQMFGMGNIVAGSFHEEFLKMSDRANCVQVTFTNGDANYQRDVLTVYSDTYDTDGYEKPAQITMDGCTKYSQAYREGMYQLLCNKYQKRIVTFECGIDAIACTVGDVVIVSHDVPRWQYSGRVESVNGNTVVLPCQLDDTSGTYLLQWRESATDTLRERNCTIVSSENWWTTATISGGSVGTTISAGDVFSLSVSGTENKLFTIQSITRAQDFTRTISCIEYDARVFAEPSNYDPDESQETLYSVMIGQMANELITITATRGVVSETYTTSFTKQQSGWSFTVNVIGTASGYVAGRLYVNGVRVKNGATFPLNKDYMVTVTVAEVGSVMYANGQRGNQYSSNTMWYFYKNSNFTENTRKSTLVGKLELRYTDALLDGRYNGSYMFGANATHVNDCCKNVVIIEQNVDTSHMTTLYLAFAGCVALTEVDVSNWDVSNVTTMASMFGGCYALLDVGDISNWNTVSLQNAHNMFTDCRVLESLDLSHWQTHVLTDIGDMFYNCYELKAIDISKWDTTNISVINSTTFNGCSALRYIIMDDNEVKFSGSAVLPNANANVKYLVPASMVASYKAHANWSSRASQIDSIDNYTIIRADGHVTVTGG